MSGRRRARTDERTGYLIAGLVFLTAILFGLVIMPWLGKKSSRIGTPAPDFALATINGKPETGKLRLSDLDGKVVILDFWASWCRPCRMQAPIVERVAKAYAAQGVTLVGIATSDQRGAAEHYARESPSEFPALFDEDDLTARAYRVEGLPTLVVIDKQGKLVALKSGLVRERELEALVESALSSN